ncbi:hypothetical protein [Staphylococcus phage PT1-1]
MLWLNPKAQKNGCLAGKVLSEKNPQRLFRISDGSKTSSYWRKKNTALVLITR